MDPFTERTARRFEPEFQDPPGPAHPRRRGALRIALGVLTLVSLILLGVFAGAGAVVGAVAGLFLLRRIAFGHRHGRWRHHGRIHRGCHARTQADPVV